MPAVEHRRFRPPVICIPSVDAADLSVQLQAILPSPCSRPHLGDARGPPRRSTFSAPSQRLQRPPRGLVLQRHPHESSCAMPSTRADRRAGSRRTAPTAGLTRPRERRSPPFSLSSSLASAEPLVGLARVGVLRPRGGSSDPVRATARGSPSGIGRHAQCR